MCDFLLVPPQRNKPSFPPESQPVNLFPLFLLFPFTPLLCSAQRRPPPEVSTTTTTTTARFIHTPPTHWISFYSLSLPSSTIIRGHKPIAPSCNWTSAANVLLRPTNRPHSPIFTHPHTYMLIPQSHTRILRRLPKQIIIADTPLDALSPDTSFLMISQS
ncbi:hypothetical protein GGR57DRAFT_98754 [Xylariaceae sp. FL1272]|nr:hypothetical protein GGR57DRAFT_98754 [Xylariaceae sp. FL1272]